MNKVLDLIKFIEISMKKNIKKKTSKYISWPIMIRTKNGNSAKWIGRCQRQMGRDCFFIQGVREDFSGKRKNWERSERKTCTWNEFTSAKHFHICKSTGIDLAQCECNVKGCISHGKSIPGRGVSKGKDHKVWKFPASLRNSKENSMAEAEWVRMK